MMKRTVLAAVFASASAFALAAPATYAIDPTHTYAGYELNHLGLSVQNGMFTKVNGTVSLDEAAKKGAVDVTIDAASLNTYFAKRDEHLKGADFFNVAKYPTLTFKSTELKYDGDKLAEVKGKLTLLGVTKPVTLTVTRFAKKEHPMLKKEAYGVNATTSIKRSDFGMAYGLPGIADEVKLNIALEAIKAS
ncbi:YceI family protein [Crenobacter cavernae]|uniref:Polyisoprenoid-binding protein n=1 Tax=Crenobacter cavernae TaxID=2290923 RepID=A0A345Y5Z9_9NEIS|nr:YceI family protein [Crenobacter cavernae]AXK39351.1 polyisoprenoid-binding protein [Crenobacter cavernae]